MITGWPPGLLQDDDKRLSKWLAGRINARQEARLAIEFKTEGNEMNGKGSGRRPGEGYSDGWDKIFAKPEVKQRTDAEAYEAGWKDGYKHGAWANKTPSEDKSKLTL